MTPHGTHAHSKSASVHPLHILGLACSCPLPPSIPHTSHIRTYFLCNPTLPILYAVIPFSPTSSTLSFPFPTSYETPPPTAPPSTFHCTGIQYEFSDDEDIHTVASLLKLYLRELPVPLIEYSLYDSFSKATRRECWLRTPPVENRLADGVHSPWWSACQCQSHPSTVMCW